MVTFLRRNGFAAGYAIMLLGLAILLAGFATDAALHARDPDLASEEGVFTANNPGHVLVMVGLACILVGAFAVPYSRWLAGRRSPLLSAFVPLAALTLALSASVAFAIGIDSLSGEDHPSADASVAAHDAGSGAPAEGAAKHGGHAVPVLPQHELVVQLEESTLHEPPNPAPVTEENLRFGEEFLAEARGETAQYQDVAVAQHDGYFQITQDLPLIGAHFFNPGYVGSLDPAHPGILLYEQGDDGGWKLVGLAYMLPKQAGVDTPPETPFGGLARWHYHTDLCFGPGVVSIATSASECNGLFVAETPWLLHVWAWKDSPEGVFDHANSLLQ